MAIFYIIDAVRDTWKFQTFFDNIDLASLAQFIAAMSESNLSIFVIYFFKANKRLFDFVNRICKVYTTTDPLNPGHSFMYTKHYLYDRRTELSVDWRLYAHFYIV